MGSEWGVEVERQARELAAGLGAADFVYEPLLVAKGNATREVSDGLLIAGTRGLILQSKARSREAVGDRDKEISWAAKHVTDAAGQVDGTRRTISTGVTVTSLRGYELRLDVPCDWPGVVLMDCQGAEGYGAEAELGRDDVVVMSHDDWQALHTMLLSTSLVIDYVHRVLDSGIPSRLGREVERYSVLAQADASGPGSPTSRPLLPSRPLSREEFGLAMLVDEWIDQIGEDAEPDQSDLSRAAIVLLDSLPPTSRFAFGEKLLDIYRTSHQARRRASGLIRVTPGRGTILFLADAVENWTDPTEDVPLYLRAVAEVRHAEFSEIHGEADPVLVLGRIAEADGSAQQRTFVYVDGPAGVEPELRWAIVSDIGILTRDGIRHVGSVGRNERCPCGSGDKSKRCHLKRR